MPDYTGGFAGDRAGIMNLEGVLGNVANMAMQNKMFNAQLSQQQFERQMAQQQFGLQEKQFGLSKEIEPWMVIANMLGWGTQGDQRIALAQAFRKMMAGGSMDDVQKILGGSGTGTPAPGTTPAPDSSKGSDYDTGNPIMDIMANYPMLSSLGLGAAGTFAMGPLGGLGFGSIPWAARYAAQQGAKPYPVDPNFVVPPATPTPMANALFSNALQNVTKRQSRASGTPTPQNSAPTAQALPSPSQ